MLVHHRDFKVRVVPRQPPERLPRCLPPLSRRARFDVTTGGGALVIGDESAESRERLALRSYPPLCRELALGRCGGTPLLASNFRRSGGSLSSLGFERLMVSSVRHFVMQAAQRLGVEEQLKQLRALTDEGLRRDLRDHQALKTVIAAVVPRDGHTVDVGAHAGDFVGELVRVAPNGRHLAYEPIPGLATGLREQFPQVEVREAALSDSEGTARFQHVVNMPGYSGLRRRRLPRDARVQEIEVRVERLDDRLPDGFRPAFIKIDVEGAELQVLHGARETIRCWRPLVAFEHGVGGPEMYGTTSGMLHDFLVLDCGMRIFDLAGDGPYSRVGFEALFEKPIWNFIACP